MMPLKIKVMPLVLAMLFLLIGLSTSWLQWNKQKQQDLHNALSELLIRIESVFDDAHILASLASSHIGELCTDDEIRTLSRLTASQDTIRSVNIIENGEWYCSSLEGRQSLGIVSAGTTTKKVIIEAVNRQKTDMYMTYFPFQGEVVAVAVYKGVIEQFLQNFMQIEGAKAEFSLNHSSAENSLRSSEYPFNVKLTTAPQVREYINENSYIIGLFVLLACLLYVHLMRIKNNSPLKAIEKAINNGEFIPYYQPVIELSSGNIIGAEVLIRWLHPEQGIIPPNEFINAAEQSGLVKPMTIKLMGRVIKDITRMKFSSEMPFHIGLNIPPLAFKDKLFIDELIVFIEHAKKSNGLIMVEITERQQGLIDEKTLKSIKNAGAELALDDFGTGYSNYEALQNIKPTFLKIDKMFVDSLGKGGVNEAIVHNIVQLSMLANIPLIAEGIETAEQLTLLRDSGVQFGQGYYFSRPIPIDEFIEYISKEP